MDDYVAEINREIIKMRFRSEGVTHLHYMAPLSTMSLIAAIGIISYKLRQGLGNNRKISKFLSDLGSETIADPSVQFRRDHKNVFGRSLHDCVPLYIGIFTPMQYVVTRAHFTEQARTVVFAEVNAEKVFELEGVCYTNGNAASSATQFYNDAKGLDSISWDVVLRENRCWSPDMKWRKMAEVLVPMEVPPELIDRYVLMNEEVADEFCQRVNGYIENGFITHTDFEIVYNHKYFYSKYGESLYPNG